MTNDECLMTINDEIQMTKQVSRRCFCHSNICASFVIGHSSFVIWFQIVAQISLHTRSREVADAPQGH